MITYEYAEKKSINVMIMRQEKPGKLTVQFLENIDEYHEE
jgi:hypothetical protein